MNERLNTLKTKIQNNPLPYLTATAGVTLGLAAGYKLGAASTVTVGKWVQDLEKKGCAVFVMSNSLADKIGPAIPKR